MLRTMLVCMDGQCSPPTPPKFVSKCPTLTPAAPWCIIIALHSIDKLNFLSRWLLWTFNDIAYESFSDVGESWVWWIWRFFICRPAADSILIPPTFPIASLNQYTPNFSGVPQKLTWCQQFGLQIFPKWSDAEKPPQKNAVFRCFFGRNKFSRPNGRLSPIACHTYLESYGT